MRILVDIGNSRCKSAYEDDDGLHPFEPFAWHDVFIHEQLKEIWLDALDERVPDSIYVSNVAGERLLPNLGAWCCQQWGVHPIAVTADGHFKDLQNGYREPATFGVDRWMAMIGAREMETGALCVIDSGTATTVDIVNGNGQHIGGAILPGIYTMRRSLGKYTAALFAADGEITPFSDNTAQGIAGGTGYALVGALDRLVEEAEAVVGPLNTYVTGGESNIVESLMRAAVVRDPLLVLKGISMVASQQSWVHRREASRCPTPVGGHG